MIGVKVWSAVVLALAGCGGGSSPRPIETARPGRLEVCADATAPAPPERTFGTANSGFMVWQSRNGRFVIGYEFRVDDDKDGDVVAEFSEHHGVPGGDKPHPFLFDLERGSERAIDDLMTSDPRGRFAVIRAGRRVELLDSRDGRIQDLGKLGLDLADDQNQCMPPRQIAFDPTGRLLVFIQRDGRSIVTWDLETGRRDVTRVAKGRLWRAYPAGRRGWLRVDAVVEDINADGVLSLPVQRTTCACRYCQQFAAMSSTSGWAPTADLARVLLVRRDGRAVHARTEVLVPISDRTLLGAETRKVVDVEGRELPLPDGCIDPALGAGGSGLLLECAGGSRVWWPETGRQVALGGFAVPLAQLATIEGDRAWLPIALAQDGWGKKRRAGRVDLESGAVEIGPDAPGPAFADDASADVQAAAARLARSCDAEKDPPLPATCAVHPAEPGEPVGRGPWTLRCAPATPTPAPAPAAPPPP